MKEKDKIDEERSYQDVIANLVDTYYFTDVQGIIREISFSGAKIMGLKGITEIIGKKVTDFYANPDDRKILLRKLKRHKKARQEIKLKKADGTIIVAETYSQFVYNKNGKIIGIEGILRDITERKKTEKALIDSEEKFRYLFDNIFDGLTIFDAETFKFEDANKTALLMYGYEKEEFLRLNTLDVSAEPHVSQNSIRENIKKENWKKINLRYHKKKDGTIFPVEITSGVFMIDGRKKVIGAVRDISERIKAQNKLIQAQRMDSIGNLAGGIAHDFNNMLGGIMGYTSLLLDEEEDQAKKMYLQKIADISKAASDLTKNLLAYGRRGKNLVKAVNLNERIYDVLSIVKHSIKKSILIKTDLEEKLWLVDGDPSQINQMLMNLIVNASEAITDLAGQIKIKTKNIELKNTDLDLKPGKYVELSVTDNGEGIDEKIKNKIFEPFFSTKKERQKQGTGLGLATTYGIVKNHGGQIEVFSKLKQGTTFSIFLPKGTLIDKKDKEKEKKISSKYKGKILVIDDEKLIVDMLKIMLKRIGYEAFAAETPTKAFELFRKKRGDIDAVILDMNMPKMSGKEIFIKMKEIDPNVRVLLSSGYGHNEAVQEIINLGAKDLLPKPYKMNELGEKLAEIIKKN